MNGTWWLVRPRSAPTGITFAAGSAAVVAAAVAAASLTAPSALVGRLVAMAVCVAAVGTFGDLVAALATAAIAWTVLNGFLVDRLGVLAWHGAADAVRLGVLLGVAAAGWLGALSYRVARLCRDMARMRAWLYGDSFASSICDFKEASPSG